MILNYLDTALNTKQKEFCFFDSEAVQGLINAMNNALIDNQSATTGLPYWAEQGMVEIRQFTYLMSKLGYATVKVTPKFSTISFNIGLFDKDTLISYRREQKLNKYRMRSTVDTTSNVTKAGKTFFDSGLVRTGFAKAVESIFTLDIQMLSKYRTEIEAELVKGLMKQAKQGKIKDTYFDIPAHYGEVVHNVVNSYIYNPSKYSLEAVYADNRGRAIFKALKRIGNPISNKEFRALLISDRITTIAKSDTKQLGTIYRFIAELLKLKRTSEKIKTLAGYVAYLKRELPSVKDDLHARIWLERIYANLDLVYANGSATWQIPIEVDASMSIAQIVASLTNDIRLLNRTNIVPVRGKLRDPWHVEGVRRDAIKSIGTPIFYGSSASAVKLLKAKGLEPIPEELDLIRKEFKDGGLSIMKQFKNAIISNYSIHKPEIKINIWNDSFTVRVNKFKPSGEANTILTEAYDSKKGFKLCITNKPIFIPDYKRMKLYWATCLVHNLDSQIMNGISNNLSWSLPIHDASVVLPIDAERVRNMYATRLKDINDNRFIILDQFCKSIGATSFKAEVDFMRLYKATKQSKAIKYSPSAMK